jgi:hypothetical protein
MVFLFPEAVGQAASLIEPDDLRQTPAEGCRLKKRADPVPEAPTRVGSGEGNNRSKVLPLQKFCRETASNPGPGDSAS